MFMIYNGLSIQQKVRVVVNVRDGRISKKDSRLLQQAPRTFDIVHARTVRLRRSMYFLLVGTKRR
jgi:hypothetical protein